MNRRDFIKKIGGAGVAVMTTPIVLAAATAPKQGHFVSSSRYIVGVDPINNHETTDRIIIYQYRDGKYWSYREEKIMKEKIEKMHKKSFENMILYGEEIYKIGSI
jgi:hypothetical protein